jgi:hypothetical protein
MMVFGTLIIGDHIGVRVIGELLSLQIPKTKSKLTMRKSKVPNKSRNAISAPRDSISLVYNPRPIVPKSHQVVLRFQEYVGLNSGATTYAYSTYSMNSALDPLYTIGGGSCTGFVQWMTLYNRFYVTGCRISSTIYNGGNSTILHYHLAMRSDDAGAGVTPTVDKILEGRNGRYAVTWPGAHPSNGRSLTVSYAPTLFEGLPATSNRTELSGDASSDPAIQPAVQVGFIGPGTTTGIAINMLVVVEYTTIFYSPRLLGDT